MMKTKVMCRTRQLYSDLLKFIRLAVAIILLHMLSGCSLSFSNFEYREAQSYQEKSKFKEAIEHYRKVIARIPEEELALKSAREAGRLALFETKNFTDALYFYEHIVKFTRSDNERRSAQKTIAEVYLEKLGQFEKAREVINQLLILRNSNSDVVDFRFDLARAEFYLNNFSMAEQEVQEALKIVEDKAKKYDLYMFLGNINFNTKKTDQAILAYEKAIELDTERAKADKVAMNIVVSYEDAEQFDKAIAKLEQLKSDYPDPEFIDLKIKRMKARKTNLPGYRGLRK